MIGTFLALVLSVTDGDTFKVRISVWDNVDVVTAVRLRGIDTPEIKGKCPAEKALALAAKTRLTELLNVGPVTLFHVEPDKYYGRVDADVSVNGTSIAGILIKEGLARPYTGGARASWCP